ncbi:UNKNOWN [Stylonychia lemnae]|uniref:Uncharacterized protein n=1 Tax=Stylonychia lemnae TaxID=5949 RepID=A0A078A1Z3_STYLE|nr:UNKNOWN [Stylonychia lemnae]|eukprot:CDW76256.1 UNKNOWN [Stylonychia lemnae]
MEFNSYLQGGDKCPDSKQLFESIQKFIVQENYAELRVRGLKLVLKDDSSQAQYVEAEFLCESEQGLLNLCKFLEFVNNSHKILFVKIHISGDKHVKHSNTYIYLPEQLGSDIQVLGDGTTAVAKLFFNGVFSILTDFKFTDFKTEPFSLMILVDSLIGNPNLLYIELSRDFIDDETAAAIIQRLYGNPRLQKINLDGNPISTGLFKEQYIRPYFSTRKDLKILLG